MEKRVNSIVFRQLTYADFRHINKRGGEEAGGGGQSYIDFPTADIPLSDWFKFLGPNTGNGAGGRPQWDFTIQSFGLDLPKDLRIYQRRSASVSVAAQKIHSKRANRVPSWHPNNGFPDDYDPSTQNLVVYIVKTTDGEFWAGWFLQDQIPTTWIGNKSLSRMFIEEAGYIKLSQKAFIETTESQWPFYFNARTVSNEIPNEEDVETELVLEDTSPKLQELIDSDTQPAVKERVLKIRQRNNAIVKNLKQLYRGMCQITGDKLTFKKRNGELYSEVHHLIPLGENGSDSYANAIVVSPLIHRMLHYAEVSGLDLSKIADSKLKIQINGQDYEITWHPEHTRTVEDSLSE
ncbi:HNH endonuclease [Pontibacter populi]|uniref:HNH nuclease domain-containing protein n=1 Tax=Pontibacter populi TaxID=890055 RepID=A0ABV1RXD2_9BACT